MKMNKWTMGLAAAGVVTLSSVAQAQDAAAGAEALAASTTLSGYVSTGYKFNNGAANAGYFRAAENRNAFSLDVVDLKLSSAQGDGAMDTGYTVELWMGPAASSIGTGVDTDQDADGNQGGSIELMQANIDLRLGGIDLKIGQFNTVIGAETYDYSKNLHRLQRNRRWWRVHIREEQAQDHPMGGRRLAVAKRCGGVTAILSALGSRAYPRFDGKNRQKQSFL